MANVRGLKGRAWAARCFAIIAAALVAVLLATPAEARRKFGSGSSGSKSSGAMSKASAAAPKMTDKMFAGLVLGRAASKAAAKRLTKVFDLPESEETRLPDGRYLHIGRLEGMLFGKSYVGYVSSTEYISLSNDALMHLIDLAGFGSLEVFEDHIASTPPPTKATAQETVPATAPVADAAAAGEPMGLSFAAKAALGGLGALLLGFIGYCLMVMRQNQTTARPTTDGAPRTIPTRVARVTSTPSQSVPTPAQTIAPTATVPARQPRPIFPAALPTARAPAAAPVPTPSAATSTSRRTPRDLSALTRRPQPA